MAGSKSKDKNPKYWDEYSNLQRTKHELIRSYLNGWFPKLGTWSGRIVYFDTHAGRGVHESGHLGSPLVALDTLLEHFYKDKILAKSEVHFYFIESDENNLRKLASEVESRGKLHDKIYVHMKAGECFSHLDELLTDLKRNRAALAPAFAFVDPYGFAVPGRVLRDLLAAGHVELFINVIWRELDMAISQGRENPTGGMAQTLNEIFDGNQWIDEVVSDDFDERADQAVRLLSRKLAAKWSSAFRMLGDNKKTRYLLLHLTNHDAGRALMKECMWKVCPEGGFFAVKDSQLTLLAPNPDFSPLHDWLCESLQQQSCRWQDLHERVLPEIWTEVHVNKAVRHLLKNGTIEAHGCEGSPTIKKNPVLKLV